MNRFFAFMEGAVGRGLRVLLGAFLVYLGIGRMGGPAGSVLALVGLLPIAMGLWGPCLVRIVLRRSNGRDQVTTVRRLEKDPVCGMNVPADTALRVEHGGKTYVFCAEPCLRSFRANPAGYVSGGARRVSGPATATR